jgi:hypothetical protein
VNLVWDLKLADVQHTAYGLRQHNNEILWTAFVTVVSVNMWDFLVMSVCKNSVGGS